MSIAAPTVNVSSGYWGNVYPKQYARGQEERAIGMALARRSVRGIGKIMRALNGVAPGAAVTDANVFIAQGTAFTVSGLGGVRQVRTVPTQYEGVTTTAQRDYINANIYDPVMASQTYPRDLSGNGGGGKVQRGG